MPFIELSYIELDDVVAIQLPLFSPFGEEPIQGKLLIVPTPGIYQMYRVLMHYYSGDGFLNPRATKKKIELLFFRRYPLNPSQADFELFLAEEYATIIQRDKVTAFNRRLDSNIPSPGIQAPIPWGDLGKP